MPRKPPSAAITADAPPVLHVVVPHAAPAGDACRARMATLALPQLARLAGQLAAGERDAGPPDSLSPPHARVLARAAGLPAGDGRIPWAAQRARALGLGPAAEPADGWAFLTPCHWQVGREDARMGDPTALALDAAATDALRAVVAPYFAEDGITLHADQPGRWLAHGAPLAGLASAAPDRVIGRLLGPWMPKGPEAATLRRLQAEVQMLLYTHPWSAAREAQGLPAVNSFWAHGTGPGTVPQPAPVAEICVLDALRKPALRDDADAWAAAWEQLDAGPIAVAADAMQQGRALRLTLCGESAAQTWEMLIESGGLQRLSRRVLNALRPTPAASLLEPL